MPERFPLIFQAILPALFSAHVRVDNRSRHTFIVVEQAANAGNANDFFCCCRHFAGTIHDTIVDTLMGSFVIEKGLKFKKG